MKTKDIFKVAGVVKDLIKETRVENTIENASKIISLYSKHSGVYISTNDRILILLTLKSK